MQVFYVNIGGGEPTVRPRLLGAARLRHRPPRRREVLHQRHHASPPRRPAGWPPATTSTCRSPSTAPPPRSTTPSAGEGSYATAIRAMEHLAAAGFRRASSSRWSAPGTTSPSSTRSRPSPTATAPSCGSPGCARRAAAPTSGTSCTPPPDQQRELYDWLLAHGEDVLTGDSFFHLAGYGESLPGPQPVRRRPGGLPDRPGRRRLRLPVRHPRRVPRRQRPRAGRLRRACGASPSCSASCASRRPAAPARPCSAYDACRGGCMAAKFFTGLPLDGPDPECVKGHGEPLLAEAVGPGRVPQPTADHSHAACPVAAVRPGPDPAPVACDENPLRRALRSASCVSPPRSDAMARTRGSRPSPRPSAGRRSGCRQSVYSALLAGSEQGVTLDDNLAAFGELGFAPTSPASPPSATCPRPVMGQPMSHAGAHLPHRRAGRRTPTARSPSPGPPPTGASPWASAPSPASRSRRSSRPTRRPSSRSTGAATGTSMAAAHRAGPGPRGAGAHRHPRLVVLPRPRLGQPARSPRSST